jgi:hypothetical protein
MEYAYNPKDLEENRVLKEECYTGICDLDNDINPIWKRANFRVGNVDEQVRMLKMNDGSWDRSVDHIDEKIYQRMKFGLRLATLLLQESGPFFSQLIHGQLEPRQVRRLHPHGTLDEWRIRSINMVSNPRYTASTIASQLKKFTDHVAESSLTYLPSEQKVTDAWGETQITLDERCRYAIGIGSMLTDVFCTPRWHKSKAQTRRFYQFQLALTLVHELAHVAWRCRRWDHLLSNPDDDSEEVIFSPNEEQIELGQTWENWCFGGELRPIDTFEDPPKWLGYTFSPFSLDTANKDSIQYRDCRFGGHAIPAKSINQFFQRRRWTEHKNGTQPFDIEKTPVSSTTTDPADGDIDDGFMTRMTFNQENKGGERPNFIVED